MAKVFQSVVIDASALQVWAMVRDFNGLPGWLPVAAESRIEQNARADQIGCVRNFSLKDGGRIRERLLALSDFDFSMSYAILESPMGVEDYVSTLRLFPITDGDRTYAEWSAEFNCPSARETELVNLIGQNVFLGGLRALQTRFNRR